MCIRYVVLCVRICMVQVFTSGIDVCIMLYIGCKCIYYVVMYTRCRRMYFVCRTLAVGVCMYCVVSNIGCRCMHVHWV